MAPKTAVVLAAGLGTRIGGERPKGGLLRVAGREILYRTLTLLSRNGVDRFVIVTNERYAPLYREFVERHGFNAELVINPPEPEKGNGHSLHLARERVSGGEFVLVMSDHVYGEEFVARAVKGGRGGLVADRRPEWVSLGGEATKVWVENGRVKEIGKNLDEWDAVDTGFFVLDGGGIFSVTGGALEMERGGGGDYPPLSEVVKRAGGLPVTFVDGLPPWTDVDTPPEDVKRARKMLVSTAVKGSGDGFISRHLNRKISTRLSYLLAERATPPNAMTAVTFVLGILSALTTLISLPLAGVLYQLSSILDGGVDGGELARAGLRTSRFGGVTWIPSSTATLTEPFSPSWPIRL